MSYYVLPQHSSPSLEANSQLRGGAKFHVDSFVQVFTTYNKVSLFAATRVI